MSSVVNLACNWTSRYPLALWLMTTAICSRLLRISRVWFPSLIFLCSIFFSQFRQTFFRKTIISQSKDLFSAWAFFASSLQTEISWIFLSIFVEISNCYQKITCIISKIEQRFRPCTIKFIYFARILFSSLSIQLFKTNLANLIPAYTLWFFRVFIVQK